jgi:hypothetical protein
MQFIPVFGHVVAQLSHFEVFMFGMAHCAWSALDIIRVDSSFKMSY